MTKNIKDYLHLYLGCEIEHPDSSSATLIGVIEQQAHFIHETNQYGFCSIDSPFFGKPILRPLSDMTEEEKHTHYHIKGEAQRTVYLLSKHFDLFGLIDTGLAIEKTKIFEQQNT